MHSPLNATIYSVSVLQITAERTESLVEGGHAETLDGIHGMPLL